MFFMHDHLWHAKKAEAILCNLKAHRDQGLAKFSMRRKQKKYGSNQRLGEAIALQLHLLTG